VSGEALFRHPDTEGENMHARPLRIAYGRISQETNAFSPVDSTLEDFRRSHLLEGEGLRAACSLLGNEAPGWTPVAELSGFRLAAARWGRQVEPVPLFSAWALPSGPLSEDAFLTLRNRLVESLRRAGPVDGVYLAMHGAMRARGPVREPEGAFLAAVRETVGPGVPVAVTLDLHAQLTPALVDGADLLVAYRTNPHWDLAGAGWRAGSLLVRALRGEIRPVAAWRSLPMVFGGGTTLNLLPPMRSIFRRMKRMERNPKVLCASLFMCHVWNDSPDLGWSTHVVTDGDRPLAEALAEELANRAWAVRHVKPPRFVSAEEALTLVRKTRLRRRLGTVCLSDASDNVGAGGTGENTHLLRAVLEHGAGLTGFLPILDAPAVEDLWDRPTGSRVALPVGGRLDPETHPPVTVEGTLLSRKEMKPSGRAVAIRTSAGHGLVITDRPPFNIRPGFFRDLGLEPRHADFVVVKSLFHFRVFYVGLNRRSLVVRTRGSTDLDLVRTLRFNDPVHPMEDVADWRGADRRRRGA